MKVLIVEDEILASKHLQQVLKETGDMTVISVLESVAETVEWFRVNPEPDIMFLDIHLADGSAFEIFRQIVIRCPVIFTTAYDEYALRAFKVNSVDYLLKPVEVSDVRQALSKLQRLSGSDVLKRSIDSLVDSYTRSSKYRKHFLIPSKGDKLIPVQASELACFYIDAGVVKTVTSEGKTYLFDLTLDELSEMLDPGLFFRANRQYIISRAAIKDIDLWFNSRLSVNLKVPVPDKIIISKARIQEFRKWFGA